LIDLHTHILPGVDDGVATIDEAVEFARVAAADGVRTVVATPHCREGTFFNDRPGVLAGVERLRAALRQAGVGIEILPGAEVHICPDLVERVRDGRATTLADNGRTLLLELSMVQYPPDLEILVFQLKLAGIITLFAHPERIRYFRDDPARYEAVIRLGAYGQITTGSLVGDFGPDVATLSRWMVERRLVHVIASDAHNVRGRAPVLSHARRAAENLVGADWARRMVDDVPAALLRGEEPEVPPPQEAPGRAPGFLRRLLRRG
jgi:protein-tyrosine phosphatase